MWTQRSAEGVQSTGNYCISFRALQRVQLVRGPELWHADNEGGEVRAFPHCPHTLNTFNTFVNAENNALATATMSLSSESLSHPLPENKSTPLSETRPSTPAAVYM